MSDQETARDIAFCSFLPKYEMQLPFLMYFHKKFFEISLLSSECSLNV